LKSIIWRKSWNVFIKNLNFFSTEERKTWTSWMTWGVSKLSAKVFLKVNYSFNFHSMKKKFCGSQWGSFCFAEEINTYRFGT